MRKWHDNLKLTSLFVCLYDMSSAMAPQRVSALPRQQSLLLPAVINPFVQDTKLSRGTILKVSIMINLSGQVTRKAYTSHPTIDRYALNMQCKGNNLRNRLCKQGLIQSFTGNRLVLCPCAAKLNSFLESCGFPDFYSAL